MQDYNFEIHPDTFFTITRWLEILNQYDDNYLKESIANYKIRRAQQSFANQNSNFSSLPSIYVENTQTTNIIDSNPNISDIDLLEMQTIMEQQQNTISNFHDRLEDLSDRINLYLEDEEDDNLIDFFK